MEGSDRGLIQGNPGIRLDALRKSTTSVWTAGLRAEREIYTGAARIRRTSYANMAVTSGKWR